MYKSHFKRAEFWHRTGADYDDTSGTLTFAPGETGKTVRVPLIDDTVEDGGETVTLTLSNAAGAHIVDAEATGTILNTETPDEATEAEEPPTEEEPAASPLTASFSGVPRMNK